MITHFKIFENNEVSPELKRMKNVDEMIEMCKDKYLVVHSQKDFGSILDARKKDSLSSGAMYVFYNITNDDLTKQEIRTYYSKSNYDTLGNILEKKRTGHRAFEKVNKVDYLFEFVKYNIRRGNPVYVTDSVISRAYYNSIKGPLFVSRKVQSSMHEIIKEYDATSDYPGSYGLADRRKVRVIPKSAVLSRDNGITYIYKNERYILKTKYGEFASLTIDNDRYFNSRGWLESSDYYNSYNKSYTISKPPAKDKTRIHKEAEYIAKLEQTAKSKLNEWVRAQNINPK